jgi:NADH-quinone oxidoreductase subunit H
MGEYIGMFATGGMAITLFLGGWSAPFAFLTWIPSYFWFFAKLLTLIAVFIWVRGTLPRLRMDQLMNLAWEFMLPMTLLNLLTAGAWHFMSAGLLRWFVCSTMVVVPYILLSRGLKQRKKFQIRTYHFSE